MLCVPSECHHFSIFSSRCAYFHLSFVQYCSFLPLLLPCYCPSKSFFLFCGILSQKPVCGILLRALSHRQLSEKLLLKALRGAATWPPWFQSSRLSATPHLSLCLFQCSWRTCGIWWGPDTGAKVLKWDVSFSRMLSQLEASNWVIKIRRLECWRDEAATTRVNGSQRSSRVVDRKWECKKKKGGRKRKQNRQVWKECGQRACVGKVPKQNDDEKKSNKTDKIINPSPENIKSNETLSWINLNMHLFQFTWHLQWKKRYPKIFRPYKQPLHGWLTW